VVPRRYRVFLWVGPLVLVTWLAVAFSEENQQSPLLETIFVGLFWGTMFGHTTLAAAWSAFGPGPLVVRLPLSLVWVAMLPVVIVIQLHDNPGSAGTGMAILIGACLLGQWLFLQLPFWGLAIGLGLRLQHCDDVGQCLPQNQFQFTIRQLVAITGIVGLLFGIGRVVLPNFVQSESSIFALLAAAQVVLTLPLVLAALLRRFTIPGISLSLVLIATATVWEMPLLALDSRSSVQFSLLVAINVGTALVMLLILAIVRLCGYSLAISRVQRPAVTS
jgi:hypothetical protein